MIEKLSDIVPGKEYCFYLRKERRLKRRAVVHALINESEEYPDVEKTEAFLTIYYGRKRKSHNLLFASEFGIGETHEEAFRNYGRFKHEAHPGFETSAAKVQERFLQFRY